MPDIVLKPLYDGPALPISIPVVLRGDPGASAYDVARTEGYEGSVADWLASLVGKISAEDRAELGRTAAGLAQVQEAVGATTAALQELAAPLVALDNSAGVPLERFDRNFDFSGQSDSFNQLQSALMAASAGGDRILLPKQSMLTVLGEQSLGVTNGGIDIEAPHGNFVIQQRDTGSFTDASPDESHAPLFDISRTRGALCRFRGFRLIGDHSRFRRETYYHDQAHNQIYGVNTGDVVIEDMIFERGRGMIVNLRGAASLRARGNTLRKSRRDGFFIVNPIGPVLIDGNRFEWTGDDMVHILHVDGSDMWTGSPPGTQDVWITNNSAVGGRGFLLTNVRRATFAGNHARFNSHRFLRIGAWNAVPASYDIDVYGNICEDLISGFENGVSRGEFIGLLTANASKGDRPAIPGRPAADTGTVERPEPYMYVHAETVPAGTPAPHARGIRIHHNTYRRTAKAGRFVDHGMGPYIRWDSDDYGISFTDDAICPTAFTIQGPYDGLSITDNDCQSIFEAVRINLAENPTRPLTMLNSVIERNSFRDMSNGGMVCVGGSAAQQGLAIRANLLDGDPYFRHPARVAGGRWANDWQFTGINLSNMRGIEVSGNTFRNWTRPIEAVDALDYARYEGNTLFCDPVQVRGSHPDNRGIRWLRPNGRAFRIVLENSDPTSESYGQLINTQPGEAASMPTTGKWVEGAFVRCTDLQGAARGWTRLTTGSGNVAGTDWRADPAAPVSADVYVPLAADADTGWLEIGASNELLIHDTSTLTAGRALVLRGGTRTGQRVTYICRTKGGFKRWFWDGAASRTAADNIGTNTRVSLVWTGSAWLEVSRGAA